MHTIQLYDPFRFIDDVFNTSFNASETYPPYNIREVDSDTRVFELAVAGFAKEELKINLDKRTLTISGEKAGDTEVKYLHKGIATRKFKRAIALWEFWEVESADLNNGILYIVLKRHVPEEKKPKEIEIR